MNIRKFAVAAYTDVLLKPVVQYTRWKAQRSDKSLVYQLDVPPDSIRFSKLIPPKKLPVTGKSAVYGEVGGPWDLFKTEFRNHYVYESIKLRIVQDEDWINTPLYKQRSYRNRTKEFESRCKEIDDLIESLRENGYQMQCDLHEGNDIHTYHQIGNIEIPDEIIVAMDRRGRLIHLRGGRHRLAISRVEDLDEISVVLSLYHPLARDKIPEDAHVISEYSCP